MYSWIEADKRRKEYAEENPDSEVYVTHGHDVFMRTHKVISSSPPVIDENQNIQISRVDGMIYHGIIFDPNAFSSIKYFANCPVSSASLKFGENDLVLGPSAERELSKLQQRAGGRIATQLDTAGERIIDVAKRAIIDTVKKEILLDLI